MDNCKGLDEMLIELGGLGHYSGKDPEAEAVADPKGTGLTLLNCRSCHQLTNRALQAIGRRAVRLESLSVSGCYRLTDQGVVSLVRYTGPQAHLNRLKRISIVGCYKIKDHALRFLFNEIKGLHILKGRIGAIDPLRPSVNTAAPIYRELSPAPEQASSSPNTRQQSSPPPAASAAAAAAAIGARQRRRRHIVGTGLDRLSQAKHKPEPRAFFGGARAPEPLRWQVVGVGHVQHSGTVSPRPGSFPSGTLLPPLRQR